MCKIYFVCESRMCQKSTQISVLEIIFCIVQTDRKHLKQKIKLLLFFKETIIFFGPNFVELLTFCLIKCMQLLLLTNYIGSQGVELKKELQTMGVVFSKKSKMIWRHWFKVDNSLKQQIYLSRIKDNLVFLTNGQENTSLAKATIHFNAR